MFRAKENYLLFNIQITITYFKISIYIYSQTNSLEYTIENADISHSGDYICRATNKKGYTEDITIVKGI